MNKINNAVVVGNIYETTNYEQFMTLVGNRNVDTNSSYFKNILESIKENGQLMPALIYKESLSIVDGQHRFVACVFLNIPFRFIVLESKQTDASVSMKELNTVSSNWTMVDYLNFYETYNDNYRMIKNLHNKHNKFSLSSLLRILGVSSGKTFNLGKALVNSSDIEKAEQVILMLYEIGVNFSGFKTRSFISAYMDCLNNPEFNHYRFVDKIKVNRLDKQPTADKYLREIEGIYNHGLMGSNRIRLY